MEESSMRVMFDTNTVESVGRPERFPKNPQGVEFYKVHDALKARTLEGYFSETIVTLEGIEKKDRIGVMGGTRIDERFGETVDQDTDQVKN
jgi:hypothetical protein